MSIEFDAEGYIVKTDPYDAGVRMKPAVAGVTYEQPEDTYSPAPKRGDYTGRVQPRIHWRRGRRNVFDEFEPAGRGGA
jgi:hypothetical protein